MANRIKIRRGSGTPTTSNTEAYELAYDYSADILYIHDGASNTMVPIGGGGDADTLDGLDSTQFLRSDADDETSGELTAAEFIGPLRGPVKFTAKADVAITKGDAVYVSGISGNTPTVDIADANDSNKMPAFGIAQETVSANASIEIITFGDLSNINTFSYEEGDVLYVSTSGTTGNTLTATPPSGESSLIQNIGKVLRRDSSVGRIKVGGAGRSNATPNLNQDKIFLGNASNQAVSTALSSIGLSKFNNDSGFTTNTGTVSFNGSTTNGLLTYGNSTTADVESTLTFDASSNLNLLSDSGKLRIGAGNDLQIYHNGTNDYIESGGTAMFFKQGGAERIKFNSAGNIQFNNSQADINTRFATTGSLYTLWVDGGTDRVGIGTNSPSYSLDVIGTGQFTDDVRVGDDLVFNANANYIYQRDSANTLTRVLGINGSNTTYIGPIDSYAGGRMYYGASSNMSGHNFYTGGTLRMKLDGYVLDLPNTGDWSSILNNTNSGGLRFGTKDSGGTLAYQIELSNTGNYVKLNENVGIGGITPLEELDINGSLKVRGDSSAATEVLELGQFASPNGNTPQYTFNTYDSAGGLPSAGDHLEIRSVRWGQNISFSRNGQGGAVPTALFYNGSNQGYMELYRATNPTTDATYTTQVRLNVNGNSYLNGGNVGIGNASPSYKLDITHTGLGLRLNSTGDQQLRFERSGGNAFSIEHDASRMYLYNRTTSAATIAVTNAGNFGIGTVSPSNGLELYGAARNIYVTNTTEDEAGIIMQDAQDPGQNGRIVYDSGANKLHLQTHGGTGFTMDASRNIGIGNSSPADKLHVYLAGSGTGLRLQGAGGQTAIRYQNDAQSWYTGINSAEQYYWYSSQLGATWGFINTDGNLYNYYNYIATTNDRGYLGRDSGGTVRTVVKIDSSNNILLGDSALSGQVLTYPTNYLQVNTNTGYLQIGPQNTSHCHYTTDRANHWFNQMIYVNGGVVSSYNSDLQLRRNGSSADRIDVADTYIRTITDNAETFRFASLNRSFNNLAVGPINNNSKAYIRANNGYSTATTPDYTWWYNDQCGIYHPAGNTIGFSASGEKVKISTYGLYSADDIYIGHGGSDYSPGLQFMGGSNTPGATEYENAKLAYYDNSGTGLMRYLINRSAGTHSFRIGGNEVFYVDAAGQGRFTGTSDINLVVASTDSGGGIAIKDSNTSGDYYNGVYVSGNELFLKANNSERFRVNSSGSTFTGDVSVDGHLTLQAGHSFRAHNESKYDKYRMYGTSSAYAIGMYSGNTYGGLNDWAMTFTFNDEADRGFLWRDTSHGTNGGAMGLTTNGKLTVAHSARIGYGETDTTIPGATYRLDVSGSIGATADVVAYISSDKRLKDNIKNIENPLEKLQKLNGVEFDWNDKQDLYKGHDIGVIAQEVEEVLPEIVDTREDGHKAVKYDRMVALLIEVAKEQQQQINELKEKLNG